MSLLFTQMGDKDCVLPVIISNGVVLRDEMMQLLYILIAYNIASGIGNFGFLISKHRTFSISVEWKRSMGLLEFGLWGVMYYLLRNEQLSVHYLRVFHQVQLLMSSHLHQVLIH